MTVSLLPVPAYADEEAPASVQAASGVTDYYRATSQKKYAVSPGVTEQRIIYNNADGTDQNIVSVMEVDLSNQYASVMPSYKDMNPDNYGTQVMTKQAAAAESKLGVNVVGGINVNLSWSSDEPIGMLVINGKVYHNDTSYSGAYLAVDKDGKAELRSGSTPLNGSEWQAITVNFGWLVQNGKSVYPTEDHSVVTRAPRTAIGLKEDGTLVLVVNDGRQAPISAGMTMHELAEVMLKMGCVSAVNCDGGGSSTFLSEREGTGELSIKNSPSDGVERPTLGGLLVISTASPSGVFDHAAIFPSNEIYTPGTSVQFSANGIDVGGLIVDMPEGLTYALSEESAGLGTIDASTGLFTAGDKEGTVTVQLLDGSKVVGSTSIEIAKPDSIYFGTDEMSLGFNDSTDFNIFVRNKGRDINYKAGDLVWSLSDEKLGTFEGNIFTSSDGESLNGVVTVKSAFDSSIGSSIKLIVGMLPTIVMDFEDYTDPDTGKVIPAEEYYSIDAGEGTRFYTTNYGKGGKQSAEIVSIDDDEPVRFGSHALKLNYDFTDCGAVTEGACFGYSEKIAIPGMPTGIGVWVYAPEGVGIKWDGDGTDAGFWLRGYVSDGSGGNQAYDFTFEPKNFGSDTSKWPDEYPGVWWEGWRYLEADLTKFTGPFSIQAGMTFRLMYVYGTKMGTKSAGSLYFDNLQFVYGTNVDDVDNPGISCIKANDADLVNDSVINTDTVTFYTETYDVTNKYTTGVDTIRMYIDGVNTYDNEDYNFKADPDGSKAYLSDVKLSAGQHSLTVTVRDKAGNETSETRYFTIEDAEAAKPLVSIKPNAEKAIIGKTVGLEIRTESADVKSIEAALKLGKQFKDYEVTFADNFEGSSEYKTFTGSLVINAAAKEDATVTAGDLIATVTVNVPTDLRDGDAFVYAVRSAEYVLSDGSKYTFSAPDESVPVSAMYTISAAPIIVGKPGTLSVVDVNGKSAAGISIYLEDGTLVGETDTDGKLITEKFSTEAGNYVVYAKDSEGNISFNYKVSSYENQAQADGKPYGIIHSFSSGQKSISWFSDAAGEEEQVLQHAPTGTEEWTTVPAKTELRTFVTGKNQAAKVSSVALTGLDYDTTYDYRVGCEGKWSDVGSFKLRGGSKFFVLGDIQAEDLTNINAIMDNVKEGGFSFGIQTGDAVDNAASYSGWMDIISLFGTEKLGDIDMLHVLGNHEYAGDGDASAAAAIYNLPTKGAGSYYSVTRGDVYMAVINYTGTKAQLAAALEWLKTDAANNDSTWKILCMHQPSYYTNVNGGNAEINEMVPPVVDELGIDFVFSGHDHSYARTEPIKDRAVNEDGTVYFICGSSGEKSYSTTDNPAFHFAKATQDYNAVYLSVNATSEDITIIAYDVDSSGTKTVLDSYKKEVPICKGDHEYTYNRSTDELVCKLCPTTEIAGETAYSGWATESESGRAMYFVGGKYVTGYRYIQSEPCFFDDNGEGFEGEYVIDGQTCVFEAARFARSTTAEVTLAGKCGDNVYFILYTNGDIKLEGSGPMYESSSGSGVPWYQQKAVIKHAYIGKDITTLSGYAFFRCSNLQTVDFAKDSKLESVGKQAFLKDYSLKKIIFPDSVTTLGTYMFSSSGIETVVLPKGTTLIPTRLLEKCEKLTSVVVPETVASIRSNAFIGSDNVVLNVIAGSYAEKWAIANNVKYVVSGRYAVDEGTCGDNVKWALYSDGILELTGSGDMSDIASTGGAPWYSIRDRITEIHISKDITSISRYAFYKAYNVEKVVFEEGSQLKSIGNQAFVKLDSLKEITLPDSVTSTGTYVFAACENLEKVTLPAGMARINTRMFNQCTNLKEVYIPDAVNNIVNTAFAGCDNVVLSVAAGSYAEQWAIANNVKYVTRGAAAIGGGKCGDNIEWALYGDGVLELTGSGDMSDIASTGGAPWYSIRDRITEIHISKDITSISRYAFYKAYNVEKVVFEEGSQLKSIGNQAFVKLDSLKEITLPDSVTSTGTYVFAACENLEKVTLPAGMAKVNGRLFNLCTNLKEVYVPETVSSIVNTAFYGCDNVVLSVAAGSYAEQWAIANNVKYVNYGSELTTLEVVETPAAVPVEEAPVVEETVNSCGDELTWTLDEKTLTISGYGEMYSYNADNAAPWAAYADDVENIVIGKHVKTIGAYAFSGLEKLVNVSFDDESEIEIIEEYAFAGCKELTEIKLPEKLEKLGEAAFADCAKLSSVELPESLVEFEIITIKPENEEELENREPVEVFDGCDMSILKLKVAKGSAAEAYAVNNGIAVVYAEEDTEPVEEVTETPVEEAPAEEAPTEETPVPAEEIPTETPAPETEPQPEEQTEV